MAREALAVNDANAAMAGRTRDAHKRHQGFVRLVLGVVMQVDSRVNRPLAAPEFA